MTPTIYLWLRQDGKQPKALARGAKPPGPGPVVAVQARSPHEARAIVHERSLLIERLGGEPSPAQVEGIAAGDASGHLQFLLVAVRPVSEFTHRHGEAAR